MSKTKFSVNAFHYLGRNNVTAWALQGPRPTLAWCSAPDYSTIFLYFIRLSVKKYCALYGLVALWAWFDIHLRCYCCCFRVGGRGESIVFQKIHIHAFPMLSNKHQLTTPGSICMGGLEWVRTQVLGKLQGRKGAAVQFKSPHSTLQLSFVLSSPSRPPPPTTHQPSVQQIYALLCIHFHCKFSTMQPILTRTHARNCLWVNSNILIYSKLATGKTSLAITPFHFFDYWLAVLYQPFLQYPKKTVSKETSLAFITGELLSLDKFYQ